ncbi:MAG: hypothetical protein MUC49_11265 [Raineya sp.]|jgi:hypothetical protein|nr:hypothetical protein [Raineya sp.]
MHINNAIWDEILKDLKKAPLFQDIIINFFKIDNIDPVIYSKNEKYFNVSDTYFIEIKMNNIKSEITPSFFHFLYPDARPSGYPDWFITAYPDVALWFSDNYGEVKNIPVFKDILSNEHNYIHNNKFNHYFLRLIINYYKNNINSDLECSFQENHIFTENNNSELNIILDLIGPNNSKSFDNIYRSTEIDKERLLKSSLHFLEIILKDNFQLQVKASYKVHSSHKEIILICSSKLDSSIIGQEIISSIINNIIRIFNLWLNLGVKKICVKKSNIWGILGLDYVKFDVLEICHKKQLISQELYLTFKNKMQ